MQKLLLSEKIVMLTACSALSLGTLPVLAVDSTTPATAQPGSQAAAPAAPSTTPAATPAQTPAMTSATTPAASNASPAAAPAEEAAAPKVLWKPGQSLETSTDTEDIVATYDIELARKQVAAYPDSPEAAFILAVALTRTSRVEEALTEVRRARKLAESKGGPAYFDKLIASYEKMLTGYPNDNQVRYGLAWAYYMKAYLLGSYSRKVARWKAANAAQIAAQAQAQGGATTAGAGTTSNTAAAPNTGVDNKDVLKALKTGNAANALGTLANIATGQVKTENLPHIPTALEKVDPADIPTIKSFYEKALGKIDEILQREPNDIWSIVYSAHLRAEYSGNLEASMKIWRDVAAKNPSNPAPYFFLGEGYLKQGNLKESINNVSKAIALRAIGN